MNAPEWVRDVSPEDEVSRLRVPPHSVEAEQSVLGGLLLDNAAWDRVGDLLVESDFYRHEHRLIFAAIGALVNANRPADVITVFEHLSRTAKHEDAGGLQHLNALAQCVPSAANIRRYAEIVRERAVARKLITTADEIATSAFNPQGKEISEILDRAQAAVTEIGRTKRTREPVTIGSVLTSRVDRYNDLAAGNIVPGISTGKPTLDDKLGGGLRAGLYVIAARPSVGKSSFAAEVALHIAESRPTLFLSQEMQIARVADRVIARIGGIRLRSLITGKLADSEWSRLPDAIDRLSLLPFNIDDEPAQRLATIRRKARSISGLGLLVVDYLQLCGSDLKTDNRNLQIEELTRGLKALSTELDIPILALSQLNRAVEARANKRPNLGDLRDSGAIEQDADAVIFLWPARENYDDKRAGVRIVGVGIDKNRDGELGEMALEFRGAYQQWDESDYDPRPSTEVAKGGFE